MNDVCHASIRDSPTQTLKVGHSSKAAVTLGPRREPGIASRRGTPRVEGRPIKAGHPTPISTCGRTRTTVGAMKATSAARMGSER